MPTRLRRFVALESRDQRLLVEAILVVLLVRVGLRRRSFRLVRRAIDRLAAWRPVVSTDVSRTRVAWAVQTASRAVPGQDTCLVRGLVAAALLGRRNYPATLRFGVRRDSEVVFMAHLWVESGGETIAGATTGSDSDTEFQLLGTV